MPVFDDFERILLGGAGHLISAFDYLNNSARPEAARVREKIEEYFARYPAAHQEQLKTRLRSRRGDAHHGAMFELIVHEMLLRSACTIEAVEPEIAGTANRPDFLVRDACGHRFYLECIAPTGQAPAELGAQRRLDDVLNAIDAVTSPDFLLAVFPRGAPAQPVAVARLRRDIEAWLRGLDYDAAEAAWRGGEGQLPEFTQAHHGMEIKIEAVPRQKTRGEIGDRAIGMQMGEAQWVDDHIAIREAVRRKSGRYGALDLPYVVAVNCLCPHSDEDTAVDALFGGDAVQVWREPDGATGHRNIRIPDGAWMGRGGPINTRVSAVLSTEQLTLWSLRQRRARIFFNPWATRPMVCSPMPIDEQRVEHERLSRTAGQSIGDLLDLDEGRQESIPVRTEGPG